MTAIARFEDNAMPSFTLENLVRVGAPRKGVQLLMLRPPNGTPRFVRLEDLTAEQFLSEYPIENMTPEALDRFHADMGWLSEDIRSFRQERNESMRANESPTDMCHYCGGTRKSHTDVVDGVPGHRINRPDMPQHGEWHPFKLYDWMEMQKMYRDMGWNPMPMGVDYSVHRAGMVIQRDPWNIPCITDASTYRIPGGGVTTIQGRTPTPEEFYASGAVPRMVIPDRPTYVGWGYVLPPSWLQRVSAKLRAWLRRK
jgi:hypothetical protein